MVTTELSPSPMGSTWPGMKVTSGRSRRRACRSRQCVQSRGEGTPCHSTPARTRVGVSVDVLVPSDVIADLGDAAVGHRLVPFPRVPRGLRLGREQWSVPWRFGAYPRALPLLHSVLGVAPMLSGVPLVLTVPDLVY